MFQGSQKILKGHKWVTSGGKKACARCAALDGQEFYYDPKPDQKSTADMPKPPLHPNCRCKTIEIMDFSRFFDDGFSEASQDHAAEEDDKSGDKKKNKEPQKVMSEDDKDKDNPVILGLVFGSGGRSTLDGPAYGYYGGQNWQRGQNVTGMSSYDIERLKKPRPEDDLDSIFKRHDEAYNSCEKRCDAANLTEAERKRRLAKGQAEADRRLVNDMQELQDDEARMRKLLAKKSPKERDYTKQYLFWALWWFRRRANMIEVEMDLWAL